MVHCAYQAKILNSRSLEFVFADSDLFHKTSRQDLDDSRGYPARPRYQNMTQHRDGAVGSLGVTLGIMLFVWQCPMMLMSYGCYGWATFLLALTLDFVCVHPVDQSRYLS